MKYSKYFNKILRYSKKYSYKVTKILCQVSYKLFTLNYNKMMIKI